MARRIEAGRFREPVPDLMAHETFGEEYQIVEAVHHLPLENFRLDLSFQAVLVQLVARNAEHFAHAADRYIGRSL